MNRFAKHMLALAAVGGLGAKALAADPSYDELLQKVDRLQSRLDEVESRQDNAKVVDATVERVLKDADRRSQLLADGAGFTAGYDKGFFLKSEDNNYVLRPGLLFQFRGVTNLRTAGDNDTQSGFEFRRLRPRIDGNFITPDLTYTVVWDANRSGGGVSLLDAYAQYRFAPQWAVKLGQFRESWFHEGDVPDYFQLTVERSLVDAILAGSAVDRVQGISLIYGGTKDDALRAEATYHDGANSKNTDFRDAQPGATSSDPPVYIANFGFGGRVEYKVSGDWANYRDFTAKGNKQDLLVVGAGIDWTQNGDNDVYRTTADLQWENTTGWNFYTAVNGNFTDLGTVTTGDDSRFDWGALAQVGYLFRPEWEGFARYDVVHLDDDFISDRTCFSEFTVGLNYFLGSGGSAVHKAKITVDLVYLPDGSPSNQTGTGVLSSPDGDAEFVLRGQFQLLI